MAEHVDVFYVEDFGENSWLLHFIYATFIWDRTSVLIYYHSELFYPMIRPLFNPWTIFG